MSPSAKSKRVLISAMRDKVTGNMSVVYNNFYLLDDFRKGGAIETFITNMNPNLRNRIKRLIEYGQNNFNMNNLLDLQFTGRKNINQIAAHAEIRALDDLAKQKF